MADRVFDPKLLEKLSKKTEKDADRLRVRICQKAGKAHVGSRVIFLEELQAVGISGQRVLKNLTPAEHAQLNRRQSSGIASQASAPKKTRDPRKSARVKKMTRASSGDLLPDALIDQANKNARTYIKLFWMERSIRNFIVAVMSKGHGPDWWKKKARHLDDKVDFRKKREKLHPYTGVRGESNLDYTDFGDLKKLIERNLGEFNKYMKDVPEKARFLTRRLGELEMSRNNIAHMAPLRARDRRRLEDYADDWFDLLPGISKLLS